MTFKIERLIGRENEIVLCVCGGMQTECVNTLKELIEAANAKIVLDLSEVTLANRDAAMFLAVYELKDIELRNCRCGRRAIHPRIHVEVLHGRGEQAMSDQFENEAPLQGISRRRFLGAGSAAALATRGPIVPFGHSASQGFNPANYFMHRNARQG
jgi:hypothetical protein